jgi:hypothetical protein
VDQAVTVESSSDDEDRAIHEAWKRRVADGPSDVPGHHSVHIDAVLECKRAVPRRARLHGRLRHLPDDWVYIGRGSTKFGLDKSVWANPFVIGRDGNREECIQLYTGLLRQSPQLLSELKALSGKVLACHCDEHEPCHADSIIREFEATLVKTALASDVTSDEDELGEQKAAAGAGWVGRGHPLDVGRGSKARGLRDGGGLCSPGRWPPPLRRLPPAAVPIADILDGVCSDFEAKFGDGFGRRLVCKLACGKVEDDPLLGMETLARSRVVQHAESLGFVRDGAPEHPANVIDFELLAFLARHLGDPDWSVLRVYRRGVRLGWHHRLPRTPAVCVRKVRWASHVGDTQGSVEFSANYRSAEEIDDYVAETFEAQLKQGMLVKMTYAEARARFGERLRIASLGAVVQGEDKRIIHDGTHHVRVNSAIRVRDQDETPLHQDLLAVLDHEAFEGVGQVFGLAFDVSKVASPSARR